MNYNLICFLLNIKKTQICKVSLLLDMKMFLFKKAVIDYFLYTSNILNNYSLELINAQFYTLLPITVHFLLFVFKKTFQRQWHFFIITIQIFSIQIFSSPSNIILTLLEAAIFLLETRSHFFSIIPSGCCYLSVCFVCKHLDLTVQNNKEKVTHKSHQAFFFFFFPPFTSEGQIEPKEISSYF